jgi:polyisoprenyl-phosphate glycosyltransferase
MASAEPEPGSTAAAVEPTLSVVVPIYNEAAVIEQCLLALDEQLAPLGCSYEVVCVDDGSTDETPQRLGARADADARVRVVTLSRNFGKESAIAAGIQVARGQAVVLMDADMQHPPELIPRMLELWEQGHDVVNAVKQARVRESLVYRTLAGTFNLLMGGASKSSFRGASDFKLIDRQVVEALLQLPERNRFFRGLIAWVGFRTAVVPFTVAARAAGKTKWSTQDLLAYSLRNLLAFSAFPLRVVTAAGFGTLIFAVLLAFWTVFRYVRGDALSGFTTVILLQLILDGLLLASVGVIALYLAEMFAEVKQRPTFIVRDERRPRSETRRSRSLDGDGHQQISER